MYILIYVAYNKKNHFTNGFHVHVRFLNVNSLQLNQQVINHFATSLEHKLN